GHDTGGRRRSLSVRTDVARWTALGGPAPRGRHLLGARDVSHSARYWPEEKMNDGRGSVSLSSPALDAIPRHGQETYPHECCGALIGYADPPLILVALPLPNTTEEGPRRRFLIRPSDYREAEQAARAAELSLLGFYHSHPDHPAEPSQHD